MKQFVLAVVLLVVAGAAARMSNEFRSAIMDRHNEYRKEQTARYMNKLEWDDGLESHAESYVADCNYDNMERRYGYNAAYYRDSDDQQNMYRAMNEWYNEKDDYNHNDRSCGSSCRFTQMVWYNTRNVGCAHRRCENFQVNGQSMKNYWFFACFYDPRGNMAGEYPYMQGNRCEDCGDCQNGLCVGGPKQCYDIYDECAMHSNACGSSKWMNKFCMKTCNKC